MILRSFALFFLIPIISYGQTPEEDEVIFQSAVDWLDSKLNYIYYDEVGEKWWNNTFYINDKKEVTIKHIASSRPNTANIQNKTYTIRSFKIQDIDPQSLKVTKIKETKGRLVKGDMLELRTFGFQDLIHKTINKRRGSSTSFLFLSFPEIMNDSLANYAEIVKQKFEEAILASTRIYPGRDDTDKEKIFSTLNGSYETVDGQQWKSSRVNSNVLRIETAKDTIQYFGFDEDKNQFYLLEITDSGFNYEYFQMNNESSLSLSSDSTTFQFITLNTFKYNSQEFFRK